MYIVKICLLKEETKMKGQAFLAQTQITSKILVPAQLVNFPEIYMSGLKSKLINLKTHLYQQLH